MFFSLVFFFEFFYKKSIFCRGEQKNRKTDLTEKTGKKLPEKTEPIKKTD
jgi:hypothetical protein